MGWFLTMYNEGFARCVNWVALSKLLVVSFNMLLIGVVGVFKF